MKIETKRHSLSHILAMAVKKLYPNVKLGIGPAIEDGFYYDFDNLDIEEKDLKKIEKEMRKIIEQGVTFKKEAVTNPKAKQILKGEPYKLELLKELEEKPTFYTSNGFTDLCLGPHIKSSKELDANAFKLTRVAGAYWKGDSKNKMLTRIYGVAFNNMKELKDYLIKLEEAQKRNHIKIGKDLDLFSFNKHGPGFVFLHNKGMVIWDELMNYWEEEHKKEGYELIRTPVILNRSLWEKSGHWENYMENMYTLKIDNEDYAVKPMNCPGGMLVYKEKLHSYREFPMKVGEIGLVHRHELSGTLNGLFRVRSFFQDDAHIFCIDQKQAISEVVKLIRLIDRMYKTFGLKYHLELSTRPEKRIGTDKVWDMAESALKKALKKSKKEYKLNPGDGAFYGAKIDFHIEDALGRTWQCATIQFDFSQPERFDLTYEGKDGKKHRPIMLHRTVYGGIERFLGVLIEHYGGWFPTWLAPVQVTLVTVTDDQVKYAKEIKEKLLEQNIRVILDDRQESIGKKVRDNVVQKIPYIITIGEKEVKKKALAVRNRDGKVKFGVKVDSFIKDIVKEVNERK